MAKVDSHSFAFTILYKTPAIDIQGVQPLVHSHPESKLEKCFIQLRAPGHSGHKKLRFGVASKFPLHWLVTNPLQPKMTPTPPLWLAGILLLYMLFQGRVSSPTLTQGAREADTEGISMCCRRSSNHRFLGVLDGRRSVVKRVNEPEQDAAGEHHFHNLRVLLHQQFSDAGHDFLSPVSWDLLRSFLLR